MAARANGPQERRPCACTIEAPCLYHVAVIREHQAMYRALREIANGTLNEGDDPGTYADRVLIDVRYRHVR